jgi:thiol-disulfide isomerase/thioredoxin
VRRTPLLLLLLLGSLSMQGADLVRNIRYKLSAGDLATGFALAEDYKRTNGADAEYLNAVGWLARGAEMLGRTDVAATLVDELHRAIPRETEELLIPYGAAIEVESRLLAKRDGRGAALAYLRTQFAAAKEPSLRSRISKNINLLSLEGEPAPPIAMTDYVGAAPPETKGKPTLLFLWANWCGDCKAQHDALARIWQTYRGRGLQVVAPTRYYGSVDDKAAEPAVEKERIAKVWKESYPGLDGVSAPIDTETMVRYGASATPTFVLIDREGIVRLYAPTRLSEAELSRRIEEVLGGK